MTKEEEPKSEIEILQLDILALQEQRDYLKKVNEEKEKSYQNLVAKYKDKTEALRIDYDGFKQRYIETCAKQSIQIQRLEELNKASDEVIKHFGEFVSGMGMASKVNEALESYHKLKSKNLTE